MSAEDDAMDKAICQAVKVERQRIIEAFNEGIQEAGISIDKMLKFIDHYKENQKSLLSIHNQLLERNDQNASLIVDLMKRVQFLETMLLSKD